MAGWRELPLWFLSHSWQANWLFKYVTLLLYFNSVPAVAGALSSAVALQCFVELLRTTSILDDDSMVKKFFLSKNDVNGNGIMELQEVRFICLPFGCIVFFFILCCWHHVRAKLPCGNHSMFLDKVCIHQTDAHLKALGIQQIGAVLDNSDRMIIAWDKTYFDRLWCTFEIAAFTSKRDRPPGSIVFLPTRLGLVIAVYALIALLADSFRWGLWLQGTKFEKFAAKVTWGAITWSHNFIWHAYSR